MKIELIRWPSEDDKNFCKRCALETMGKVPITKASEAWLHCICNARHSPIRELLFAFEMTDLPYYISVHLARHDMKVAEINRVASSRNARCMLGDTQKS